MLIQFIPKAWLESIGNIVENAQPLQIAVGIALVLLVVELILITIARRLFQRSKLILD
jgi:nitrate reductase gamma subunit